jgi:hypothetical protein
MESWLHKKDSNYIKNIKLSLPPLRLSKMTSNQGVS